jgi:hypothetical protein
MIQLRDRVQGAKLVTKIDLKSGYNVIRIYAGKNGSHRSEPGTDTLSLW